MAIGRSAYAAPSPSVWAPSAVVRYGVTAKSTTAADVSTTAIQLTRCRRAVTGGAVVVMRPTLGTGGADGLSGKTLVRRPATLVSAQGRRPSSDGLAAPHEQVPAEERRELGRSIERQDRRDVLVGPDDDDASAAVHAPQLEDVVLGVRGEHLLVVDEAERPGAGQEELRH